MQARLFEIIYSLMDTGFARAKDLAERFEVSTRTIYRDIDSLSLAGIPVYSKRGKNGGIYLMEGFVLNKALLSEMERNEIIMGLESLAATGYENKALSKLRAVFSQKRAFVSVDHSGWAKDEKEQFELLKEAILNSKVIRFKYFNAKGESGERDVEPHKLLFKGKAWYLLAFCRRRQGARVFRLSRMKELVVLSETFDGELPDYESAEKPLVGETVFEPLKVRLEIAEELAYRVYDEFEEHEIKRQEGGGFVVDAEMIEDQWFYGYILSFGEYARVLKPVQLKNIIAGKIKKMLDCYAEN